MSTLNQVHGKTPRGKLMPERSTLEPGTSNPRSFVTLLRHCLQARTWPEVYSLIQTAMDSQRDMLVGPRIDPETLETPLLDSNTRQTTCYAAMEAIMAQAAVEKRATRRFAFRLRIALKAGSDGSDLRSCTRDVSARGVSFYADRPLEQGTNIQFTLTLPPEVTLTESISMRCAGRVVRVDPAEEGRGLSIAAVIDRYEFLGDGLRQAQHG